MSGGGTTFKPSLVFLSLSHAVSNNEESYGYYKRQYILSGA